MPNPPSPTTDTPPGNGAPSARPDIYRFHDYRAFLSEWFGYRRAADPQFSLRSLARQAGLACGYLPMVIAGNRNLSPKALAKLARLLGLSPGEQTYLELLLDFQDGDSAEVRIDALGRLQRFRSYQQLNPREIEVFRYLTRWYYVAIREMAALPDFRAEPSWIQKRLRNHVPLQEIECALRFLIGRGFISLAVEQGTRLPEKEIRCVGKVYSAALAEFHREMFDLAASSLENATSEERLVTAHTVALPKNQLAEVQRILYQALKQIEDLGVKAEAGDDVYHVVFSAFPLTRKPPVSRPKEPKR